MKYRVTYRVDSVRINGVLYHKENGHYYTQVCRNEKTLENFKKKHNVVQVLAFEK